MIVCHLFSTYFSSHLQVLLPPSTTCGFSIFSSCSLGFNFKPWGFPRRRSQERVAPRRVRHGLGGSHGPFRRTRGERVDIVGWPACTGAFLASLIGTSCELFGRCTSGTRAGRKPVVSAIRSLGASSSTSEMFRSHEILAPVASVPLACCHRQTISTCRWRGHFRRSGRGRLKKIAFLERRSFDFSTNQKLVELWSCFLP